MAAGTVEHGNVIESETFLWCGRAVKVDPCFKWHGPIARERSAFAAHAFYKGVRLERHFMSVGADNSVEVDSLRQTLEVAFFERDDLVQLDLGALSNLLDR
jgi:hypothetical protein